MGAMHHRVSPPTHPHPLTHSLARQAKKSKAAPKAKAPAKKAAAPKKAAPAPKKKAVVESEDEEEVGSDENSDSDAADSPIKPRTPRAGRVRKAVVYADAASEGELEVSGRSRRAFPPKRTRTTTTHNHHHLHRQ